MSKEEHYQMPCKESIELKKLKAFNACGGKYMTPDSLRTLRFAQVLSHNNALHTDDTKRQEV